MRTPLPVARRPQPLRLSRAQKGALLCAEVALGELC